MGHQCSGRDFWERNCGSELHGREIKGANIREANTKRKSSKTEICERNLGSEIQGEKMWDYKIGEILKRNKGEGKGQLNEGELYGRDIYERMKTRNGGNKE